MKKINIVKKNEDFKRVITKGKYKKGELFNIYIEDSGENIYHFGISVSKKVGNAVTRNKIKRRLKSIIDKKNYQNGFNCIIIVRKSILLRSYQELEQELLDAVLKLNIMKEKENEQK